MRPCSIQLLTSDRRYGPKPLDDDQQEQLNVEECTSLVPVKGVDAAGAEVSASSQGGSESAAAFSGAPSGATSELQRGACVVSCRPEVAHEVRGIAQALGHSVAMVDERGRYRDENWKVVFGANLERFAATCEDWLVLCGPGGQTDLCRTQQVELESVAYFFQHPFNRSLTYMTVDEYREALTMYVQALEAKVASATQRLHDLQVAVVAAGLAANSRLNLGKVEDHFVPVHLMIVGCKYFASFNGRYILMPRPHHGRNFYIREACDYFGRRPCIYFWDDRDGHEHCGWWLGFERSNGRVFAAHNRDVISKVPPMNNWAVRNWTGWLVEPSLQILPDDPEDVGEAFPHS